MKKRNLLPAVMFLLASSTSVFAAATPEQAQSIQAALQAYLGSEPGVVAVAPTGDTYDITLDPAPFIKKSTVPGFTAKIDPLHFTATPNGDGTWAVSSKGPYNFATTIPDAMNFDMRVADASWQGTFNEALGAFTSTDYKMSGITVSQNIVDPQSKMKSSVAYGIASVEGKSEGKDAGNGNVDIASTVSFSGVTSANTFEVPPDAAASMPNMNYTANIPKGTYSTTFKAAQVKPLTDLVAFFVEHPSKELLLKDQAKLKEKLLAAIPAFTSLDSTGSIEGITVGTSLGQFEVGTAGSNIGMNGFVKQGRFAEGFSVTGLKIPAGIAPPWAEGLVPSTVKIGFELSGFDAEAPARMFVSQMDVNNPDLIPPGSEALYLPAFAPNNAIKITIPAGEISSDVYSFSYEGVVDASFAGLPKVNATFKMTGMDAVIAKLQQAAADPTAQQGMAALFAVKGLGKAQPDGSLIWEVTTSADGKFLVNGTDVSSMLGGPPPAPAQ